LTSIGTSQKDKLVDELSALEMKTVTEAAFLLLVVLAFGHTRAREMGEDRGVAR